MKLYNNSCISPYKGFNLGIGMREDLNSYCWMFYFGLQIHKLYLGFEIYGKERLD